MAQMKTTTIMAWTLGGVVVVGALGYAIYKAMASNGNGGGGSDEEEDGGLFSDIADFIFAGSDDEGLSKNLADWWKSLTGGGE